MLANQSDTSQLPLAELIKLNQKSKQQNSSNQASQLPLALTTANNLQQDQSPDKNKQRKASQASLPKLSTSSNISLNKRKNSQIKSSENNQLISNTSITQLSNFSQESFTINKSTKLSLNETSSSKSQLNNQSLNSIKSSNKSPIKENLNKSTDIRKLEIEESSRNNQPNKLSLKETSSSNSQLNNQSFNSNKSSSENPIKEDLNKLTDQSKRPLEKLIDIIEDNDLKRNIKTNIKPLESDTSDLNISEDNSTSLSQYQHYKMNSDIDANFNFSSNNPNFQNNKQSYHNLRANRKPQKLDSIDQSRLSKSKEGSASKSSASDYSSDSKKIVRWHLWWDPNHTDIRVPVYPLPSKKVPSKIGSLEKIKHRPGGGNIKIKDEIPKWNKVARTENFAKNYKPGGGNIQILNQKLEWSTQSKVGSLENMSHSPRGGNIKILNQPFEKTGIRARIDSGFIFEELFVPLEYEVKSTPRTNLEPILESARKNEQPKKQIS